MKLPEQHHPELEDIYLMNLLTGQRIPIGEIHYLDNEYITGQMLFMCRTSDADLKVEPDQTNGTLINDARSRYFRNKKRRFEMQFQVKFKKVPPSKLYLHCRLEHPLKLRKVQKALIAATFKFMNRMSGGTLNYNVPGKDPRPEDVKGGMHEYPHFTFLLDHAMHRIAITKPGEKTPVLGEEIYEDPEMMKKRLSGETTEYNTEDTFTFSMWSAYLDFIKWRVVNLPLIPPFALKNVIRDQDFSMHVYYFDRENDEDDEGDVRHVEYYQRRYLSLEFANAKYCKASETRKRWMEKIKFSK